MKIVDLLEGAEKGGTTLGGFPVKVLHIQDSGQPEIDEEGVAEGAPELLKKEMPLHRHAEKLLAQNGVSKDDPDYHHHLGNTIKHLRQFGNIDLINKQNVAEGIKDSAPKMGSQERKMAQGAVKGGRDMAAALGLVRGKDGVARLPKEKKGVAEATKLAAPTRPFGDQELTDYLDRIRKQEKAKTDKYKLPYIHRSSVVGYYNEEGKKYNVDAIKAALAQRPKSLLKKNEKMKHSDGELEQFFNIGFAALVGIALDENTNELIIVNTCPGAGSCKIDCFAMKGGKIQFQGPWLSDGRILTYLLNDPTGFFTQLKNEITKEYNKGKKEGYSVSIRWHDAGDFFSPEYAEMAFKLAEELPNVNFYAYTKVADVAVGKKPNNFMINWSEGASTAQEKKVKQLDPDLEQTKNSRIVPSNLFYDLLVKDEKKNLVKGPEGQWQVIPTEIPELKDRLSKAYNISKNSILTYSEYENKVKGKNKSPLKYNVIITPGEPDVTAKDPGVLSTLLLKH